MTKQMWVFSFNYAIPNLTKFQATKIRKKLQGKDRECLVKLIPIPQQ